MHMSRMVALATALTVGIAAPALAQDKLVRVWHTETEPQTIKAFNDLARRFEAKNPGIKIEAEGLAWTDLEIRNDHAGKPQVHLCGATKERARELRISDVLLSISHCRAYATAYALAIRGFDATGGE